MYQSPGRPRRKQLKTEPADENFEQQRGEMDTTSYAADGDTNGIENNVAMSQSPVLDGDKEIGHEEVEGDESKYFTDASGSSKTQKPGPRNVRSSVWKYFERQHKNAVCKICQKSLKRAMNLMQHLRRHHDEEYTAAVMENSRRKMEEETQQMVCCVVVQTISF